MILPTEEMLREAAEDVAHEIYLFTLSCQQIEQRLAYQAWYVLARNLMDFFDTLPHNRDDDDILAGDFFHPPGHWHALREKLKVPADYERYRHAANKRASHLT